MTLHRFYAMGRYWKKHPPLHLVVAAFAGVKPETQGAPMEVLPEFEP